MSINWRIYGKETVAAKVHRSELPGFIKKKVEVGPNEAAILIQNGKNKGILKEGSKEVAGFTSALRQFFHNKEDFDLIFYDTTPINISMFIGESHKSQDQLNQNYLSGDQASFVQSGSISGKDSKNQFSKHQEKFKEKEKMKLGFNKLGLKSSGNESGSAVSSYNANSASDGFSAIENVTDQREMFSKHRNTSDVSITALSKDNEVMNGECHLRLNIDPSSSILFAGMLKGREAVATWDIDALIREEILSKVLIPRIASVDSTELRGNKNIQDSIKNEVMSELSKTISSWGLILEDFYVNWGITEKEAMEIQKKRANREEEAVAFIQERRIRNLEREKDLGKKEIEVLYDLKKADTEGDIEHRELLLNATLKHDLMGHGQNLDFERVDQQILDLKREATKKDEELKLQIQQQKDLLDFQRVERDKRLDRELEKDEMQDMMSQFQDVQKAKKEREQQKIDHQQSQMKMQTDAMENVMKMGMQTGAADSKAVQEMMKQMTMQKALDRDGEMVDSMSKAEGEKANLETFKQAEERERQHQFNMTGQSAHMMQSAKQNMPSTLIQGGSGGGGLPDGVRYNINDDKSTGSQPINKSASTCLNCNEPIKTNWKACPSCGESIRKITQSCRSCNMELKPNWKACPECGEKV